MIGIIPDFFGSLTTLLFEGVTDTRKAFSDARQYAQEESKLVKEHLKEYAKTEFTKVGTDIENHANLHFTNALKTELREKIKEKAQKYCRSVTAIGCNGALVGLIGSHMLNIAHITKPIAGLVIGGLSSLLSTLAGRTVQAGIMRPILGAAIGGLQGGVIGSVAGESMDSSIYLGAFSGAISSLVDV